MAWGFVEDAIISRLWTFRTQSTQDYMLLVVRNIWRRLPNEGFRVDNELAALSTQFQQCRRQALFSYWRFCRRKIDYRDYHWLSMPCYISSSIALGWRVFFVQWETPFWAAAHRQYKQSDSMKNRRIELEITATLKWTSSHYKQEIDRHFISSFKSLQRDGITFLSSSAIFPNWASLQVAFSIYWPPPWSSGLHCTSRARSKCSSGYQVWWI